METMSPTALIAGGSNFSRVAARARYSTKAAKPMTIKNNKLVSLSSICSVPVNGIVVRGLSAIITKKAVMKPIIMVKSCPGSASRRSNSLSVAPASRRRSDAFNRIPDETTKESAHNDDWPYVHESRRAKIPQKLIKV